MCVPFLLPSSLRYSSSFLCVFSRSSLLRPRLSSCACVSNIIQAIQQGHSDIAKIYAQNAIRKQNERLNLLRLGSRIDAVASRVQTAVTMRAVTGSMMNVVKGMDQAMKAMDLEKVRFSPHQPQEFQIWAWIIY